MSSKKFKQVWSVLFNRQSNEMDRVVVFFFLTAFLLDFSLLSDQLSGGVASDIWRGPAMCSSWAGSDMWLDPEFLITLCIVHRDGVTTIGV